MKKLAAVLLAGVMCLSLAACGSDSADEAVTSDAEAAVEETTEDAEAAEDAAAEDTEGAEADAAAGEVTTVTEGVLTMGTNAAFPPYEYYEGDEIVGIDAEIAQALASAWGKGRSLLPPKPESFSALVSRKIVSVASQAIAILRQLWKKKSLPYRALFAGKRDRSQRVAAFLAVLELVKNRRLRSEGEGEDLEVT